MHILYFTQCLAHSKCSIHFNCNNCHAIIHKLAPFYFQSSIFNIFHSLLTLFLCWNLIRHSVILWTKPLSYLHPFAFSIPCLKYHSHFTITQSCYSPWNFTYFKFKLPWYLLREWIYHFCVSTEYTHTHAHTHIERQYYNILYIFIIICFMYVFYFR